MTKEQILINYIDFIISNTRKVVSPSNTYIDYMCGYYTFFWFHNHKYKNPSIPIIDGKFKHDIIDMFGDIKYNIKLNFIVQDRIMIFVFK